MGPSLGLTKSSSLESLQTAIQIAVDEDTEVSSAFKPVTRSMVRGRGCNESFRAAVDRSYEGANDAETMDTCKYDPDLVAITNNYRVSFWVTYFRHIGKSNCLNGLSEIYHWYILSNVLTDVMISASNE